ncbi:MAG: NfeD family protein [Pirellulaceae bacterium]
MRIPLPVDARAAEQVSQVIRRITSDSSSILNNSERPVLILKFDTDRGATGSGSQLTRCLDIAQLLTSEETFGFRIVAYIPGLRQTQLQTFDSSEPRLEGHAMLVALAAQEILIDSSMNFGNTQSFARKDSLVNDVYRNIAEQRLVIPLPMVRTLVDPSEALYSVKTADGESLVDNEKFRELESAGKIIERTTLSPEGESASYSARQLQSLSPNCHVIDGKTELANYLQSDLSSLESESMANREWKALVYELPTSIDDRTVDWVVRALAQKEDKSDYNLLLLKMNGSAGALDPCLKLSRFLAGFDPDQMHTAIYLQGDIAGPSALIAAACDHILMDSKAKLGGEFTPPLTPNEITSIASDLKLIADEKERDVAWIESLMDPQLDPIRFRNTKTGQARWMTRSEQESRDDAENWQSLEVIDATSGMDAITAENEGFVRAILNSHDEVIAFYQLDSELVSLTPTSTDRYLSRFASALASPLSAMLLIMGTFFLFSIEANSPGLGVPAFFGTVCLFLFFWSQYFDGNAEWFEILLFFVGVAFILLEIFVVPGVGIFGIGGLLMMVVSIVLATQTFVLPQNAEDYKRLPVSLGIVLAAATSFLGSIVILRAYGKNIPIFRRMMLEPPVATPDFAGDALHHEWVGRRGVAITQLIPSGKAKINGKIVNVMTDGAIVPAKAKIEVVEAAGNRILVKAVEP